ncbi:MAG: TonB-dependent receptor [Methylophilaceae bacterium]|nr:TonB-dependent receptor [Methylophilaceae bacterium]
MKKFAPLVTIALLSNVVLAEETVTTGTIDVTTVAPLPGIGVDVNILPSNVQVIKMDEVSEQPGISFADYLVNNAPAVTLNEVGGNPWQPEIRFRGYTAGSILGNEQGISVYLDGVRQNQPFSDVVLWDTLPQFAFSGSQVVPGSNPIYGLNTLGGAVAFQTKNGRMFDKTKLSFTKGSWGREISLVEHGGVSGNYDYYAGYQYTTEDGWRDYSPSHLNQYFAKVGWEDEASRLEVSYTGADTKLIGNGLAPKYLLGSDNEGVNTVPDETENLFGQLNLALTHFFDDDTMISSNAYWKRSDRNTWNGDAEIELDAENLALSGTTYSNGDDTVTLFRFTEDEIDEIEGENRKTKTRQDLYGWSGQLTFSQPLMGFNNHFITGVNIETSLVSFTQDEYEGATMLPTRQLVDGTGEYENNTDLQGRTNTFGVYAVDTFSIDDNWHVTGGLRYNYQEVDNTDKRSAEAQEDGSLTERASWARVNPTIGLTYKYSNNFSTYTSYSESNRAPTSIELGCSNPAIACQLPTQMADDPPLDDVVAKTYEWGYRGQTQYLTYSGSVYSQMNHDDLQFINTNAQNGLGYFDNMGKTSRKGLDMTIGGRTILGMAGTEGFSWTASYGYMKAEYESDFTLVSDANDSRSTTTESYGGYNAEDLWSDDDDALSETGEAIQAALNNNADGDLAAFSTALDGANTEDAVETALETLEAANKGIGSENSVINVKKGDRMPSIPDHSLKFRLQYDWNSLRVGTNILAYADTYMMGNENNEHGDTNGDGKVPGYVLVNLDANYRFTQNWSMNFKAINIFDKTYYTGGRLLMNGFTGNGKEARSEVFRGEGLTPGSPQAGWVTINYEF